MDSDDQGFAVTLMLMREPIGSCSKLGKTFLNYTAMQRRWRPCGGALQVVSCSSPSLPSAQLWTGNSSCDLSFPHPPPSATKVEVVPHKAAEESKWNEVDAELLVKGPSQPQQLAMEDWLEDGYEPYSDELDAYVTDSGVPDPLNDDSARHNRYENWLRNYKRIPNEKPVPWSYENAGVCSLVCRPGADSAGRLGARRVVELEQELQALRPRLDRCHELAH
eukprot:757481-Hanusia_phi.AAC.2